MTDYTKPFQLLFSMLLFASLLAGCSGQIGNLFTVYKIDIQQGNAFDEEQIEKVQIGMTKEQVRYLLGSPAVADLFHPDRWDYVYHFIPGYGESEKRQMTLHFENDQLAEIVHSEVESAQDS